jgi:hypothetical protein
MIVRPRDGQLLLIRQTDHAALAGKFAAHWGRPPFAAPRPAGAVLHAAAHHDDGWRDWEARPRVDPATRRPYQFTDLPVAEHQAFYQSGIERAARYDPYAGLLVSMHLAGLYQRRSAERYGPARSRSPAEGQALRAILEQLRSQQQALRARLAAAGRAADLDGPRLQANYQLLQIFDRLSLSFCVSPPRPLTLGPAPVDYRGREADLSLLPRGGGAVAVSPYPFDVDPLPVAVRASVVPDRDYADDDDFHTALAAAPETELRFELRAG